MGVQGHRPLHPWGVRLCTDPRRAASGAPAQRRTYQHGRGRRRIAGPPSVTAGHRLRPWRPLPANARPRRDDGLLRGRVSGDRRTATEHCASCIWQGSSRPSSCRGCCSRHVRGFAEAYCGRRSPACQTGIPAAPFLGSAGNGSSIVHLPESGRPGSNRRHPAWEAERQAGARRDVSGPSKRFSTSRRNRRCRATAAALKGSRPVTASISGAFAK